METYAFNMEIMLHNEMDATDDAKYQLRENDEKIDQLENTIQKLKEKNASLEATNDKLASKTEDQTARIIGVQGQCRYLSKYLMKFDPWHANKKALLAAEESTPEAPKDDPKELVVTETNEEETPMEKNNEEPIGTRVKRRRTGSTKAYLAQFK
jgi:TolA-binding protein